MIAAARLPSALVKGYVAFLAVASAAGFVAGGTANFVYARNHPGADPYMPRPQIVVPVDPVPPSEPVQQQKVKVLPPAGDAPEQAPLVSSMEPKTAPATMEPTRKPVAAKKTGPLEYVVPGADPAAVRAATSTLGCDGARASSMDISADSDCRASGAVGQGAIGEMTIGAGSVAVVPSQ